MEKRYVVQRVTDRRYVYGSIDDACLTDDIENAAMFDREDQAVTYLEKTIIYTWNNLVGYFVVLPIYIIPKN